jgi:hypothetical protein
MRFPHVHSIPHLEEYKANRARDVALYSGRYKNTSNYSFDSFSLKNQ